jgi:hypothetical protein
MRRGPGIGKTYKIAKDYPNVKFQVSTVSTVPLKSLTLETKFWYEKNKEIDTKVQLDYLFRQSKNSLWSKYQGIYDREKIISVKDIPHDLVSTTKKVFVIFEFTLFVTKKFTKDMEVCMEMGTLVDNLYQDVFADREDLTKSK